MTHGAFLMEQKLALEASRTHVEVALSCKDWKKKAEELMMSSRAHSAGQSMQQEMTSSTTPLMGSAAQTSLYKPGTGPAFDSCYPT